MSISNIGRATQENISRYNSLMNDTNNLKEFIKCSTDLNYFLENYYKIITLDEGLVQFNPREWQKDVAQKIYNNRFTITLASRQIGKSILVSGILLWYLLFNNDKNIAIIANKFNRAKEIIEKISTGYDYLPNILKMPWIKKNMSEIELINESKVKAFATSGDALRGESVNCLHKDTKVKIKNKVTGEIRSVSLQELYKDYNIKNINEWQIETPDGFVDFDGIVESEHEKSYIISTDTYKIRATGEHLFNTITGIKTVEELKINDGLIDKFNTIRFIKNIYILEEEDTFYDILNVQSKKNLYYANDLEVHNCLYIDEMAFIPKHVQKTFMESTYPVITSGETSKVIITSTPNGVGDTFHSIYQRAKSKKPQKDKYVLSIYDYTAVPEHNNEEWRESTIANLNGDTAKFEQEYECKFIASTNSIFDFNMLENIGDKVMDKLPLLHISEIGLKVFTEEFKDAVTDNEFFKNAKESIYRGEIDTVYNNYKDIMQSRNSRFITVDIGEGLGSDFSVAHFNKFDFKRNKIIQEATLRTNILDVDTFAGYVYGLGNIFGKPLLFYENNNKAGGEFGKVMLNQFQYNNIYWDRKKKQYGILTRNNNKKIGVKTFKTLLESNVLEINDYDTYIEMNYFEENPIGSGKYKAQIGFTDDSLMSYIVWASVYQTEKNFFGLLFGRESIIDYILNPSSNREKSLEKLEQASDDEDRLLKYLNIKVEEKVDETFDEYDLMQEIMMNESGMNIRELEEAGVSTAFFKSGGGFLDKEEHKNKSALY